MRRDVLSFKKVHNLYWGPQGFWGSGEKGFFIFRELGSTAIIFRELGSKLIVLGSPAKKCKKSQLQVKAFISFDFLEQNLRLLGENPPPPTHTHPMTPLAKSTCIYFLWIGIGD